jgi:hypothetical protein
MRKATYALLGAALVAALASGSMAKKAGVGLEWSWVPTFQLGAFGLDTSAQEFTLAWDVSDSFSVGVFTGTGKYNAEKSYNNDVLATPLDEELSVEGSTSIAGIRLLTNVPGLKMLRAGLEAGAMSIGAATYSFIRSDGSATDGTAFGLGALPVYGGETCGMVGVTGKLSLIEASNANVTTAVTVAGSLRFVDLTDAYILGDQETNTTATPLAKIDPVKSMTNVAVQLAIGIWF